MNMTEDEREKLILRLWGEFRGLLGIPHLDSRKYEFIAGARAMAHELDAKAAAEIERLRAALARAREYLADIGDHPEPSDTVKMIDAALGVDEQSS